MESGQQSTKSKGRRHGGVIRQSDMHKRYRKPVPKKPDAKLIHLKRLLDQDEAGVFMSLFQSAVDSYLDRKNAAQPTRRHPNQPTSGPPDQSASDHVDVAEPPAEQSASDFVEVHIDDDSLNVSIDDNLDAYTDEDEMLDDDPQTAPFSPVVHVQLESADDFAPLGSDRTERRRSNKFRSNTDRLFETDPVTTQLTVDIISDTVTPCADFAIDDWNLANEEDCTESHASHSSDGRFDEPPSTAPISVDKPPLAYEMVPGAKRGNLLYVADEKALYIRKDVYTHYDRYVCRTTTCPCVVHVSKPDGVARRAGRSADTPHQHAQMESNLTPVKRDRSKSATTASNRTEARRSRVSAPADEAAVDRSDVLEPPNGDLEYEMVPGVRYGTRLLYVVTEKMLYSISNSYPRSDRYHCIAPKCRCAVRVSKPDGVVRRTNLSAAHSHPHMESKYLEYSFKHSLKRACLASKGMVSPRQLLADRQKSDPDVAALIDLQKLGHTLTRYKRLGELMQPTQATASMHTDCAEMVADNPEQGDHLEATANLIGESVISSLQESDPIGAEMASVRRVKESFSILRRTAVAKSRATVLAKHPKLCRCCGANPQLMRRKECAQCGNISDELSAVRYMMVPGVRFGSQLLYTLDERMLYKLSNTFDQDTRYVCNYARHRCACSIMVNRRDGSARRTGKASQHQHEHMESDYLRNRFLHELKKACMASGGRLSGAQLLERRRTIDPVGAELVQDKNLTKLFKQYIPAAGSAAADADELGGVGTWDGAAEAVVRTEITADETVVERSVEKAVDGRRCTGCGLDPDKRCRKVCPACGCIRYVNKIK